MVAWAQAMVPNRSKTSFASQQTPAIAAQHTFSPVSTATSDSIVHKALASVHDPFVHLQSQTKYLWLLHREAKASKPVLSWQLRRNICMLDIVAENPYICSLSNIYRHIVLVLGRTHCCCAWLHGLCDSMRTAVDLDETNRSTCFCNGAIIATVTKVWVPT